MNNLQIFSGQRVIVEPYLAEFTTHHNKELTKKRWHKGRVYRRRVQKKWDKRFGITQVPYILMTRGGIIVHPKTYERLKQIGENHGN